MALISILTINGTDYHASGRVAVPIVATGLQRSLDGGYDTLTFAEVSQSPVPAFHEGMPAKFAVDINDGNGSVLRFQGEITDKQSQLGDRGWEHGYTALGLKYLADRVPVTAVDGTGLQVYNRSPDDDYWVASDAGLTIGQQIQRILLIVSTAQRLNAYGIGNYTGLPSAPALPAATLADLALLTIVPPRPVTWSGEGFLNTADAQLQQYMPKWYSEIQPDGTIRFKDSTSTTYFVPRTITCPGSGGLGDPVTPPRVRSSTQNCATRLVLRGGPQVEVATLSLVDGTLVEVFTSTDKSNWNLTYFTAPKGASDYGTVSTVTSTSATISSHDATATWPTNFWGTNEAVITLIDPLIVGVDQFESRRVISNNALVAAGSSTVNWDTTWPVTHTAYTKYRIVGGAGGLVDTWRTYAPCEPHTGATALSTYVGSHLVVRSPHIVRVANAAGTTGQYYTTAIVKGGALGQEMPLIVQPVPSLGIFRFAQPTVTVFGQPALLNTRSPTTNAEGLPDDVIIYAMYSRGALSVTVPPDIAGVPQYEGTAFTDEGIEQTAYLDFPAWQWINDLASFTDLAQQHLDCRKNTEIDIDIDWIFAGTEPSWDFLSFDYSLNIAINGASSPWAAVNAPVRTIGLRFDSRGAPARFSASASTRRRAFAGDDIYIHPQFAQGSPLSNATTDDQFFTGNYKAFNFALASGWHPSEGVLEGGLQGAQIGLQGAQQGLVGAQQGLVGAQQGLVGYQEGLALPADQFTMMDTLMAGMPAGGDMDDAGMAPAPAGRPGRPRRGRPPRRLTQAEKVAAAKKARAEKKARDRANAAAAAGNTSVSDFYKGKQKEENAVPMAGTVEARQAAARQAAARDQAAAAREKQREDRDREANQRDALKPDEDAAREHDVASRNLDRQIRTGRERQPMEERNRQRSEDRVKRERQRITRDSVSKGQPLPGNPLPGKEDLGQRNEIDRLSPPSDEPTPPIQP